MPPTRNKRKRSSRNTKPRLRPMTARLCNGKCNILTDIDRARRTTSSVARDISLCRRGLLRSLPVSRSSIVPLVWRWSLAVSRQSSAATAVRWLGYSSSWAEVSFLLGKLSPSVSSSRDDFWPAADITFVFVVACCECLFMPFGTLLGVFTIVLLSREPVKSAFD